MNTKLLDLDNKVAGIRDDICTVAAKVDLLRSEAKEIERRKLNIVVKGLPESTIEN